jgi:hypothetical protein
VPFLRKPENPLNDAFSWIGRANRFMAAENPSLLVQRLYEPLLPAFSAFPTIPPGNEERDFFF